MKTAASVSAANCWQLVPTETLRWPYGVPTELCGRATAAVSSAGVSVCSIVGATVSGVRHCTADALPLTRPRLPGVPPHGLSR